MSYSFPKKSRLLCSADYKATLKDPRKIRGSFFKANWHKSTQLAPRLGITVAKRYIPKANRRNQIKRIIRESFRLNQAQIPAADLVISIYPMANTLDNALLRKEIDKLWEKFNLEYRKAFY